MRYPDAWVALTHVLRHPKRTERLQVETLSRYICGNGQLMAARYRIGIRRMWWLPIPPTGPKKKLSHRESNTAENFLFWAAWMACKEDAAVSSFSRQRTD